MTYRSHYDSVKAQWTHYGQPKAKSNYYLACAAMAVVLAGGILMAAVAHAGEPERGTNGKLVPPGATHEVESCHIQFAQQIGHRQGNVAIVRMWQPAKGEFGKPKLVDADHVYQLGIPPTDQQ